MDGGCHGLPSGQDGRGQGWPPAHRHPSPNVNVARARGRRAGQAAWAGSAGRHSSDPLLTGGGTTWRHADKGGRRAPQPQPQPGNLPPRTPQAACRALGGQPCPERTPRHPSLRAAPSGHLSNASASHPWPGRLQPRSNTGHSPMLPPLWSCDPSGSRLHFCTSVPSSGNWGVITSQVTERRKQKTGRAWHLGGLRRRGRPGSPAPTPEKTRPWGTGSGHRREGRRGPKPRWKPGGAGARGRCPGRGPGSQAGGGCGLDSWGAAGGPARGLGSCRPGGDHSVGWSADPAALRGKANSLRC